MAAKRSPILGYNHNVRYRGIVFHVQTEDSGLTNPHVFTHLFHGGVILSTRKLVYDPDASEEAVKSLMQSQHKACLRDLKSGTFDDKIDQYLGGTPGLLPRGTEDNGVSKRAETHDDVTISRAPTESAKTDPAAVAPMPAIPSRTTQPRGGSSMTPPPVVSRPVAAEQEPSKREVSQAFKAMQLADDADVAEVHSPAPASAAVPPGAQPERPGEYAQHKKRESGQMPPIQPAARRDSVPPPMASAASAATAAPAPPRVTDPFGAAASAAPKGATAMAPPLPQRPGPEGVVRARPPTPGPRAPTVPGPPQPQRFPGMTQPGQPPQPRTMTPPAVSRAGTPPVVQRAPTPGAVQRARAPSGGGVVMSKPAVIVGAPPKVIGGSGSGPTPVPQAAAAPVPRAVPSGRVRKAREESEGGMFGQDLISEKSLDEVILAYLSEDGTEE